MKRRRYSLRQDTWGSPVMISANVYGNVNSFGLPGIGFDSHSQATLIWEEIANPTTVTCALKAATGSAASGFGSSQTISNASTCYALAKLAVNSGGEAVAVEGATGILTGSRCHQPQPDRRMGHAGYGGGTRLSPEQS